jgi:glycerol uptake facilitator-like aquaporin
VHRIRQAVSQERIGIWKLLEVRNALYCILDSLGDVDEIREAHTFGFFLHDSLSDSVIDQYHALFIEAFGTAFLLFIIFIVTSPLYPIPGPAVPPIVALAIGAMMVLLGPLTG